MTFRCNKRTLTGKVIETALLRRSDTIVHKVTVGKQTHWVENHICFSDHATHNGN